MHPRVLIAIVLFACATSIASAQDSPTPATGNGQPPATWNLANDVLATANQISFNQGSRGVWYFLESRDLRSQRAELPAATRVQIAVPELSGPVRVIA